MVRDNLEGGCRSTPPVLWTKLSMERILRTLRNGPPRKGQGRDPESFSGGQVEWVGYNSGPEERPTLRPLAKRPDPPSWIGLHLRRMTGGVSSSLTGSFHALLYSGGTVGHVTIIGSGGGAASAAAVLCGASTVREVDLVDIRPDIPQACASLPSEEVEATCGRLAVRCRPHLAYLTGTDVTADPSALRLEHPCTLIIDIQSMPERPDLTGIERVLAYYGDHGGFDRGIVYVRLLLYSDEVEAVGGWLAKVSGVVPQLTIIPSREMYDTVFSLRGGTLLPMSTQPGFRPSTFDSHLSAARTLSTYYIRTRVARKVLAATTSEATLVAYAAAVKAMGGLVDRKQGGPLTTAILSDLETINVVLAIRNIHGADVDMIARYVREGKVPLEDWMVRGDAGYTNPGERAEAAKIAIRLAYSRGF